MTKFTYDEGLLPRIREALEANRPKLEQLAGESKLAGLHFQIIRTYPGEQYFDAAAVVSEKPGLNFDEGFASPVLREMIDEMQAATGLSLELGFSRSRDVMKKG